MDDVGSCETRVAALAAEVARVYPCLAAGPAQGLLADLSALPEPASVAAGMLLFDEGAPCRGFPLLLEGEVRVACGSTQGRELELYRVRAGEVCVVSATCTAICAMVIWTFWKSMSGRPNCTRSWT